MFCLHVLSTFMQCLRLEDSAPEGILDGCELPCGYWYSNPSLLQKHTALINSWAFPQAFQIYTFFSPPFLLLPHPLFGRGGLRQGLTVYLWPHRNLPIYDSLVLELKVCTTLPGSQAYILKLNQQCLGIHTGRCLQDLLLKDPWK